MTLSLEDAVLCFVLLMVAFAIMEAPQSLAIDTFSPEVSVSPS